MFRCLINRYKTGLSDEEMESLSVKALAQINNKRYDVEMKNDGIENVLKMGIAFSGKKVRIKTE